MLIKVRNRLATLVDTFMLNGGLNHIIFLFLFLLREGGGVILHIQGFHYNTSIQYTHTITPLSNTHTPVDVFTPFYIFSRTVYTYEFSRN